MDFLRQIKGIREIQKLLQLSEKGRSTLSEKTFHFTGSIVVRRGVSRSPIARGNSYSSRSPIIANSDLSFESRAHLRPRRRTVGIRLRKETERPTPRPYHLEIPSSNNRRGLSRGFAAVKTTISAVATTHPQSRNPHDISRVEPPPAPSILGFANPSRFRMQRACKYFNL